MQIFTPAAELPFAGHPPVGTAWLLGAPLLRVAGGGGAARVRGRAGVGARARRVVPRLRAQPAGHPGGCRRLRAARRAAASTSGLTATRRAVRFVRASSLPTSACPRTPPPARPPSRCAPELGRAVEVDAGAALPDRRAARGRRADRARRARRRRRPTPDLSAFRAIHFFFFFTLKRAAHGSCSTPAALVTHTSIGSAEAGQHHQLEQLRRREQLRQRQRQATAQIVPVSCSSSTSATSGASSGAKAVAPSARAVAAICVVRQAQRLARRPARAHPTRTPRPHARRCAGSRSRARASQAPVAENARAERTHARGQLAGTFSVRNSSSGSTAPPGGIHLRSDASISGVYGGCSGAMRACWGGLWHDGLPVVCFGYRGKGSIASKSKAHRTRTRVRSNHPKKTSAWHR